MFTGPTHFQNCNHYYIYLGETPIVCEEQEF